MEQLCSIQLSFKCPKTFNELKPCAGGWYCNGCHKVVHDMRGKTGQETAELFAANNHHMCGMFEADRIRVKKPLPVWLKWTSVTVLALGFTGIHQTLLAQQLSKLDSLALTPKPQVLGEGIFGVVEQQAEYPGGFEKLHKYLSANLKPDSSCRPGDKAFASFIVDKNGAVIDVKIIRSPFSKEMNKQIISILEKSRPWKPGIQNGKVVQSSFTIPVAPLSK